MNPFSSDYSQFYDTFHQDKNYASEVLEVLSLVDVSSKQGSKILDFGCGSGMHIREFLRQGFEIFGYDPSEYMVKQAQSNNPSTSNLFSDLRLLNVEFDFVYSLFDVINYQVKDDDLMKYVRTISDQLKIGGVVLIDGWHLPGVLQNPPKNVVKDYLLGGRKIRRIVTPQISTQKNLFPLEIQLMDVLTDKVFSNQIHIMRAFTHEEIQDLLLENGFDNLDFYDGRNYRQRLHEGSWKFVVRAIKNI